MLAGLLTAIAAAVCYGVGSVLQALAARRAQSVEGLDPRLLVRLLGSWPYLVGVGLDTSGFLLGLVAVRSLPLFVVQSIVAGFLAVAAILGALFLAMPLTRRDRLGVGVVVLGLVLIGLSATDEVATSAPRGTGWGVLVASLALVGMAVPLARRSGTGGVVALGSIAGLAFGATAVASRILPGGLSVDHLGDDLGRMLTSPASYALVVAGVGGMLVYSTALQRGSVTQATAPLVVGETVVPALVGLWVLGDRPREGWGWVAAVGFALSVLGALALARHGELPTDHGDGIGDDADAPTPGNVASPGRSA